MRRAPFAAVLALGMSMLFGLVPAGAQTPARFRVGIAAQTVNMLPLWMAADGGFFKAHGLDVAIVVTDGGSRGLASVGAGELEAMTVGLSAVLEANGKGGDYRLIASAANTMSFRFFGAPNVKHAADLKGKTVGVSALASESDVAATLALKRLGLTRRDVTIVEAGATLKRLDGLISGALGATALNAPADIMAADKKLPKLVDLAEDEPWIFTGVVVGRTYLAGHREMVLNFLKAYVEGIALALSDETRAKRVLAAEFKIADPVLVNATYADFKRRVPRDAAPSLAGAANMMRQLPALGTQVKSTKVSDYLDLSLIEQLKREGFYAALARKYPAN